MNQETFNLESVLENSDRIQSQFQNFDAKLSELQLFEESIMTVNGRMEHMIPYYNSGYGLKIMGNEYGFVKKSLNDFFQKSASDVKIRDFHAIKDILNKEGLPIGLDVLTHVGKDNKRQSLKEASKDHKAILHDNTLLGLVSPKYPSRDVSNFSFHKLVEATRDTIALNSNNLIKTELSFNPVTASAKARIFFDTLAGDKDQGWGIALQSNYAGSGSTRGGIAKVDWSCTNGQIRFKTASAFSLVNSSEANLMNGMVGYIHKHSNYWEMGDEQQVVIDLVEKDGVYAEVFDNEEYSRVFYELMGKTFVTAVNMEKSRHERALVRARETTIGNIVEEYKAIRAKYSNVFTPTDIEKLLVIVDQDPTIEGEHTQYTLIQGITRLANDPSISSVRSERLQEIGDEILLEITA